MSSNKSYLFSLPLDFTSETMLLSHLKSSYEKIVAERDESVLVGVQQLLAAIKSFLAAESDWEVRQMMLLKS